MTKVIKNYWGDVYLAKKDDLIVLTISTWDDYDANRLTTYLDKQQVKELQDFLLANTQS